MRRPVQLMDIARRVKPWVLSFRRWIVVCVHLVLIAAANYFAFVLRFDGEIPRYSLDVFYRFLPWVLTIRLLIFIPFRLHEGLWRYTSIYDLWNIIKGVTVSSVIIFVTIRWVLGGFAYPRSVYVIDAVFLLLFLGGVRLPWRIHRELSHPSKGKRVLIYGAGDAGEMIARDMRKNAHHDYEPVGFIDDDRAKVGQRIHGVPVLGTRKQLPGIMEKRKPHEILVAIPAAPASVIREILKILEQFKVPIKTLPNLRDILDNEVTVGQIRNLQVEDLLERAPVNLNPEPLRNLISGKRILITGAGGSIGSEISRQVNDFHPHTLLLLDRYENGLFSISAELRGKNGSNGTLALIGDITDSARMKTIFEQYRPEIIFHAAAHKHVPLMEENPCEAVKNNVMGTSIIARTAEETGAGRFILISTDKAANPVGVMGASKRVAELVIQEKSRSNGTLFAAVRFGNVLASNGSVVPTFLEQIRKGGPVTVTDPKMRRYFMLIPEAVQLVLHAATLAQGGEIYVLEMGEQVQVLEMARNLIRLSGYVPDREIKISFIGQRPGEKLAEELVGHDEVREPSSVENIFRLRSPDFTDGTGFPRCQSELIECATRGDSAGVMKVLAELLPGFRPS